MSEFDESPISAELIRLIEHGFVDRTVRGLQAKHPDAADDVEDAVATAVVKLVTRFNSGKPPVGDIAGYVYTAARNGVYDAHKRHQRDVEFDPDAHDSMGQSADHDLLQKEAYRAIQQIVRRWPNRNLREYMLLYLDALYYGEPLTIIDAARQLSDIFGEEVNPGSIGTWKRRALAKLLDDYEAKRQEDAAAETERTK